MNGIRFIGKIKNKTTHEISKARIGIGLEKLDRNLYDPHKVFDELVELGAKWVRIQSGWCRTEKEKGFYDFAWLDDIVDNLLSRDMIPWMCLCYGNELYTEGAVNAAGAVGKPPIHTEEERIAWDNYVTACVEHYRGRVELYEIWNEPNGNWCWRPKAEPEEYKQFCKRTAGLIKKTDGKAKVVVGSFCEGVSFLYRFWDEELAQMSDYISYHRYRFDVENGVAEHVKNIRAIAQRYNPETGVIQGETGTQSRYSVNGALNSAEWTERKQAKFLLRKIMADLATEVAFTSYFSAVDIFENIFNDEVNIHESMYGFFGVLGERFDENGSPLGEYYRKPSFVAMQTLCAVFDDTVERVHIPHEFSIANYSYDIDSSVQGAGIYTGGFRKENGALGFVYWKAEDILRSDYSACTTISVYGVDQHVKLIDLYSGEVYDIDKNKIEYENGEMKLNSIPLTDYPLLLTFGDFAEIEKV